MSDQSIPTPDEPTFPAPAEPTVPVPAEPTTPAPAEPGAPTPPAASGAAGDETLGGPEGGGVGSPVKDPDTWVTGDEPMTGPQRSYLDTLAREAGEELPASLTKAEASEQIDRLQNATGRGEAS
ncbi:DUF3072 domain-containing protein [Microbacterium imperiale]|uniref:Uncharacterized protein n=1 Tax=Microbacterium imperiale TaxID=33884 RepID=A0A9W6HGE3_9MICO|nr:hypothetical protein [Microbacterium imperiale]MDS0200498.1 DUF3072 domain-containing protein [Microbacterium imperiale]BFE41017.1 hypothetical protein GCM10017544_19730 [Microbacterium imperiale]GLJ80016.1 hypothetical protein GCM10017586_16990 [Microbacterium imperiale]